MRAVVYSSTHYSLLVHYAVNVPHATAIPSPFSAAYSRTDYTTHGTTSLATCQFCCGSLSDAVGT